MAVRPTDPEALHLFQLIGAPLLAVIQAEVQAAQVSADFIKRVGFDIPQERWFTNLTQVGNVGSASCYLMLEELVRRHGVEAGDKILMFVPESGRFSAAYALITAVNGAA